MQCGDHLDATRPIDHVDHAVLDAEAANAPGPDAQLAPGDGAFDAVGDRSGHAVTMHVPPGAQMAQKARTIRQRHRLPDVLGERAQRVDDRPPVTALRCRAGRLAAQEAGQLRKTGGVVLRSVRRRRAGQMATWQQPTP